MISIPASNDVLKLRQQEGRTQVFDPVRKRWILLTPEEHVRQLLLHFLIHTMYYPAAMIALEKKIVVGGINKRYDLIVYNAEHKPWLLAECKEPQVAVNEQALNQLLNYHRTLQCRYWLLTNGRQTYCADAVNHQDIQWLDSLPAYK